MVTAVVLLPLIIIGYTVATDGWDIATTVVVSSLAAVAIALVIMVRSHARNHVYRCDICREIFEISAWTDFFSPHCPDKKRLTCPKCGEISWCQELDRSALTTEQTN